MSVAGHGVCPVLPSSCLEYRYQGSAVGCTRQIIYLIEGTYTYVNESLDGGEAEMDETGEGREKAWS